MKKNQHQTVRSLSNHFNRILAVVAVLGFLVAAAPWSSAITPNAEELAMETIVRNPAAQGLPQYVQGRATMVYSPRLNMVARNKALDMATRNFFAHTDPDGLGPNLSVRLSGYNLPEQVPMAGNPNSFWVYSTANDANNVESLAGGDTTAMSAFIGWMNSPLHKRHLIAEDAFGQEQTHFGVGYAFNANSMFQHYWVFVSAHPDAARGATQPSPVLEDMYNTMTVTQINASSSGDWRNTTWIGSINDGGFPWTFHAQHGWQFWATSDVNSMWLYDVALTWIWTNKATYPNIYRVSDGNWLFYATSSSNPRLFFNYGTSVWESHP